MCSRVVANLALEETDELEAATLLVLGWTYSVQYHRRDVKKEYNSLTILSRMVYAKLDIRLFL